MIQKRTLYQKRKQGSLCLRNHSQAKAHLFTYIVIAFVSPIRESGYGRWPKWRGQRNYLTYKRPSLATRYEEGQQTQILLMIILYYINPCIVSVRLVSICIRPCFHVQIINPVANVFVNFSILSNLVNKKYCVRKWSFNLISTRDPS